ncbi:MAG: hypothetical protein H0W15_09765 [Gemmatimonadales bacterium]|nr:hypothetical protein [Gemmatimonadales bacterium]
MSNDSLRARIRLAIGGDLMIGDRLPSPDGSHRYAATQGRDAALVTVYPRAPIGPTPEALRSMVDRFRAAQHAALVAPGDTADVDGRACLVTPQPAGPTLRERLARRSALPVHEAIAVLRDLARALASLHRRDLTHGVLDLDAIYLTDGGAVLSGVDTSGTGTVRGDLDALGRVGYALFAGDLPADVPLPLSRHRRALPPELHHLIDSMVDPDVTRRPARAEDVLGALDAVRARHPMLIPSFLDGADHGARLPQSVSSRILVAVAAILLAAWLVAVGG